jgi:hypothetical protein
MVGVLAVTGAVVFVYAIVMGVPLLLRKHRDAKHLKAWDGICSSHKDLDQYLEQEWQRLNS